MAAAIADPTVTVRCPGCGLTWNIARRRDKTLPKTARCAKRRGGCGRTVKVPRRPAAMAAAGPIGIAVWDPPSEPRLPRPADDPCPDCGEARVYVAARGTVRVCLDCRERVIPPGVLAPYERGAEVTRAAKSQRERDLEALDLAGRKGGMLRQLRGLADDDRLDPVSLPKVEWFAEQVKATASGARLDELAALFAEAGIRPRRWWQRQPAPLTAGYDDDEDDTEEGYAVYDDEDQDDEPAQVIAIPVAQQRRATWADAFAAHGWRLAPRDYSGICPVITSDGRCRHPVGVHPPVTDGIVNDGWPCEYHYVALSEACNTINKRRGFV
jgi:hypothetical protein